ncbi:MAG: cupredoxin domain-containing protein [Nanoarchaeota archaeon]
MVDLSSRIQGDLKTKKPSEIKAQLVKEGYTEKDVDEALTKYYSTKDKPKVSTQAPTTITVDGTGEEIPLKGHETFGPFDAAITVVVIGLLIVGYMYGVPILKEKGLWPPAFMKTTIIQSSSAPISIPNNPQTADSIPSTPPNLPSSEPPVEVNTPDNPAPSTDSGIKEFSIIAKQFEFMPNEIHVKKGDKVRLKIKSIDVQHGFNLADFGVQVDLGPGEEKAVEFTANKAGTFDFSCSVYCGNGHSNMRGLLFVEP